MGKRHYYYSFDLLRILFTVGVVLFHTHSWYHDIFPNIFGVVYKQGGSFGNIFFFMTAGFLSSAVYYRKIKENKFNFQNYLIRRISFYPVFLVSNIAQVIINYIRNSVIDINRIFLTVTFIGEGWIGKTEPYNYPTWFICVLVLCYIIYYFVCRVSSDKIQYRILISLGILIGYVCRTGIFDYPFCYSVCGGAYLNFFIGCFIAEIVNADKKNIKKFAYSFLTVFTLALIFSSARFGFSNITTDEGAMLSFFVIPSLLIIGAESKILDSLCNNVFFKHFGELSLHIYCWHIPVMFYLRTYIYESGKYQLSDPAIFFSYWVILIVFSECSRLLFKKIGYYWQRLYQ